MNAFGEVSALVFVSIKDNRRKITTVLFASKFLGRFAQHGVPSKGNMWVPREPTNYLVYQYNES